MVRFCYLVMLLAFLLTGCGEEIKPTGEAEIMYWEQGFTRTNFALTPLDDQDWEGLISIQYAVINTGAVEIKRYSLVFEAAITVTSRSGTDAGGMTDTESFTHEIEGGPVPPGEFVEEWTVMYVPKRRIHELSIIDYWFE